MKIDRKITEIMTHGNRLNIALIATIVFFFAWIVAIWVTPARVPAFEPERSSRAPGIFTKKKLPAISTYNIIVDKDIFRASRRKFSATAKSRSKGKALSKASSLILLGTVILDDYRAAMIGYRNDKKSAKYYRVGNSIEGFVIKKIAKDSVVIRRGNETIKVEMNQQKKMKNQKRSTKRVRALANSNH